ncbi:uncharacterized protein TNCV_2132371 [Trichonephila clavipes]|nr:uncharacterized protein TNCV_2132371 [Trichonephila clavipes]
MVFKATANDRRHLALCHDEFRGPRSGLCRTGLTWEHDILVLKPSPCLHNGNEVDDWMGLDEWNSWFKSHVRDSDRSRDIVNLNKFQKFKTA